MRQTKPATDDPAVAKELLDLVRMGGGPDVEVLRVPAEQEIANTSADEVGDVPVFVQLIKDLERRRIDVPALNRVCSPRHDGRLHHRLRIIASRFDEQRLSC